MSKKSMYNIINIAALLIAALLFWYKCKDITTIFAFRSTTSLFIVTVTVMLVHIVKLARLYLVLYSSNIDFGAYVKTYCRVTPVSMMFPLKLGEFLRMYCYGGLLDNILRGVVIILFDRFMDTMALITAVILVWIFNGGQITFFVYILLLFLVFLLVIYSVYPGVYNFWKKYLIRTKASENKLLVLNMLEGFDLLYREVVDVTEGKGMILYFMSLTAWGVEIGSLAILIGIEEKKKIGRIISDYLTSAMTGSPCIEMNRFVIISVIFLIMIYFIVEISELFTRKKDR